MDANAYALQVQPASKSLGVVIRSAVWLGKGKAKAIKTTDTPQLEHTKTEQAAKNKKITKSLSSEIKKDVGETELKDTPISSLVADIKNGADKELLPATPAPEKPAALVEAETKTLGDAEELVITLGDRRYRIRGLDKNQNYAQLKINLLVSRPVFEGAGEAVHVDTLDCYQSRPRSVFIKQAALALLKSSDLLKRIQEDFRHCGIVGKDTNTLTGYLACVSRKLDKPLAILIQSTSAAGKSALMDAVLNLMPEERIQYSAMTGQSLFYLGETDLKHKILGIAEEEGVSEASYALKLLQSQGELTLPPPAKTPKAVKW